MSERLQDCDTWHPDTPTRIRTHKRGFDRDGSQVFREVCIECDRCRATPDRIRVTYPNLLPRLDWAPPTI